MASRTALLSRPGTLEIIHEMLERIEAHLRADGLFMVGTTEKSNRVQIILGGLTGKETQNCFATRVLQRKKNTS